MPGHAKTPGYDGPEGTEWGDQYAPGKAEWVDDAPGNEVPGGAVVRVRFAVPAGFNGFEDDRDMLVVPREGETVTLDNGPSRIVRGVHHYPDEPDFQVYVVLTPTRSDLHREPS